MHSLQPKTAYKLITVQIAVPASLSEAEMADGINETLGDAVDGQGETMFADWSIDFSGPTRTTDANPEEGDLLDPIGRCASF